MTDRWIVESLITQRPTPSSTTPCTTPSKRASTTTTTTTPVTPTTTPQRVSRRNGLSNETDYKVFERVYSSMNQNQELARNEDVHRFMIGDTVIVDKTCQPRQKWLHAPDYLRWQQLSRRNNKKRRQLVDDPSATRTRESDEWKHVDGLGCDGDKVAVITRLFQDVSGQMKAQVRWFARPGAIWGQEGPPDGEHVKEYELYYTADSTYLNESRLRQQWQPGDPPLPPVSSKTPLCTDVVDCSSIVRHVQILTPQDEWTDETIITRTEVFAPFLVTKVYDAKPVRDAEFLGEIDFAQVLERGLKKGDWDVEPTWNDTVDKRRRFSVKSNTKTIKSHKRIKQRISSDTEQSDSSSDDDDESDANLNSDDESDEDGDSEGHPASDEENDGNMTDASPTSYPTPTKSRNKRGRPRGSKSRRNKVQHHVKPKLSAASKQRAAETAARRKRFQQKRQQKACNVNAVPPAFMSDEAFLKLEPFKRAQALLHVSATPEFLPCREEQRESISMMLSEAILAQIGTCLYIHGVPGTGKTATVHSVVRELQNDPDIPAFEFVEINGMKISEPQTAYSILWEAVSSNRGSGTMSRKVTSKQALTSLETWFQTPSPNRKTTVVLVDELDQMLTKTQDVVYNFFNWPHVAHSRLIVLAVANTMDLPERSFSNKIQSRLGQQRVVFQPYNWLQLKQIVETRLGQDLMKQVMQDDKVVDLISKRVAGAAGDARKALDVTRRTIEKVDQINTMSKMTTTTTTTTRGCTLMDAAQTYKEMSDFSSNSFLKATSLIEKILLLSLNQCLKRGGQPEVLIDDVLSHAHRFMTNASLTSLGSFQPSQVTMFKLLKQMSQTRLISIDSGAQNGLMNGERDLFSWVRMNVGVGEVMDVLREDDELKNHVPKV
ncbi:Origin recognition complex, subunit 1 [Microbotryomycetes sp. JL221]|nr:Origin recognition complex, subunit 1 [Microbotryomycetes sp. JL221]